MTRRVRRDVAIATLTAVALLLAGVSVARAADPPWRCTVLVLKVNELRTSPDLRLMNALCQIGRERSERFAAAGRAWHNVGWAIRRLQQLRPDVCIANMGEAIGQTNLQSTYASRYATRFASLWYASPNHWPMLSASRYNRAGGYMSRGHGLMFTAFYVLDTC